VKILHVIAQKPDDTGSGIYVKNMMSWAAQRGHTQALVAAFNQGDCVPFFLMDTFLVEFDTEDLPFYMPGMSDEMPYPSTPYGQLAQEELAMWEEAFEHQLLKAKQDFRPDVVLAHHLWLLTAKVRDVFWDLPVMAICHGSDLRQVQKNQHLNPKVLPACHRLDAIFALNQYQKEEIAKQYGCQQERVIITGIGYDDELFYPGYGEKYKQTHRDIIYAGKMARAKGVESLLRITGRLCRTKDISLSLVGSGTNKHWEELAPDNATFYGQQPQEELARMFRAHHLFVLPSFYEGLPLVCLEAFGSGLPVVMSDIPGVKEWLGPEIVHSGYIRFVTLPSMLDVDFPHPHELSLFEDRFQEAMERMLAIVPDTEHMQALARKRSWSRVFESIEGTLHFHSSS